MEKRKRGRPPKKIIELIYDQEHYIGMEFLKRLSDILNRRYADNWEYVRVFTMGVNDYGILYKKINN